MPILSIPTTLKVRQFDSYGSGLFLASRGRRRHLGTDFIVTPGQPFPTLTTGTLLRHKRPYSDDLQWDGCAIACDGGGELTLFYLSPFEDLIGSTVYSFSDIGICQDIRKRYPENAKHDTACTPHVHVQYAWPDSKALPLHWVAGKDYYHYQGRIYCDVEQVAKI